MSKYINKSLGVFLCFFMFLTACNGGAKSEKMYDQAFLKDLTKGLTERWDLEQKPDESTDKYLDRLVEAELNRVSKYSDKKFADTQLQEKAISYINLLKTQKESLVYYSVDYVKFEEIWQQAYDDRTRRLKVIIDEYDLDFPDKYNDIIVELTSNAKVLADNEVFDKKVEQMVSNITFNKVKTSYSYSYYEAIIENITDKTFSSFSLDINLFDADGVIVDTEYASVSNLAPGQKAKLEFMTDNNFTKYEITWDYYTK